MSRQRLPGAARVLLGLVLLLTGVGHLTFARVELRGQVPGWVPVGEDAVVLASGVVELLLGAALVLWVSRRVVVGWVTAAFFVAVFPGNVSQYLTGSDVFGLDTDSERLARLFFQPVLVVWALWSTGAWAAWRRRSGRAGGSPGQEAVG